MERLVIVMSCCSSKDLYHVRYDDGDENYLCIHLRECGSVVDLMNKLRDQEKEWLSSGSESDYDPNDEWLINY